MKESDVSFLQFDKRLFFAFLCVSTFALFFIRKTMIESEIALFEVLDMEGDMGIIRILNGLEYLSIPVVFAFKFTIIATMLWVASFMFGYHLTWPKLWQIAMTGHVIFLVPELIRVVWFMITPGDPDLREIQNFYPLSLLQAIGYQEVNESYWYVLKRLNLFELAYWFFLGYATHKLANKNRWIAYAIITIGYVVPFLLWLWFRL